MNTTSAFTAGNPQAASFSYERWREKFLSLFLRGATDDDDVRGHRHENE